MLQGRGKLPKKYVGLTMGTITFLEKLMFGLGFLASFLIKPTIRAKGRNDKVIFSQNPKNSL